MNTHAADGTSNYPVEEKWVELISMWVAPTARAEASRGNLSTQWPPGAACRDRSTYLMVRSDNTPAWRADERAGFVGKGVQKVGRLMSLRNTGWNSTPDVTALDPAAVGVGTPGPEVAR
jgi:hypothetical protein